ncbi:MAG TPA: (Fe-S)-binding protein, partial [Nitrospirae bacterium]|nr:(Fe-S)-binding protein [Nitrospirota bacterium]
FTSDETMGARGRIAMLGALTENELAPTKRLSDRIFSCILCEARSGVCPVGINIPESIYQGRARLKDHYARGRLIRKTLNFSLPRMDTVFSVLRGLQKIIYPPLRKAGSLRYMPEITSKPFKDRAQVYKGAGKLGRVAIFSGCSVNYFYPHLGDALVRILLTRGYEVVVLKGEVCCGAPLRAFGFEEESAALARKNLELFNKLKAKAILSMCPTCTLTIRKQYPLLAGDTIEKIMDVNEFFVRDSVISTLRTPRRTVTYHDPCHLRYGLGIKDEPREILKAMQGLKLVEMKNSGECCGFGGFFSLDFKELSKEIGRKKIADVHNSWAETLVTSCPGCMMQLEDVIEQGRSMDIMHIVEVIDEAMHE